MKVIQITTTINANGVTNVYGLGDDGKVYQWSNQSWNIYG